MIRRDTGEGKWWGKMLYFCVVDMNIGGQGYSKILVMENNGEIYVSLPTRSKISHVL